MSHNVAYKKQQSMWGHLKNWYPSNRVWFALLDKNGKVRDWVAAENDVHANGLFALSRDYGSIPKGYTVERRGPVTWENW